MTDSLGLARQLGLADKALVSFLGRARRVSGLCGDAGKLAAGLAPREGADGEVTVFMPNCPLALVALLAALSAGYSPRLLDPRASLNNLRPQFASIENRDLVLTVDLSAVQDRLLAVLPEDSRPRVAVGRFATQMPMPQRLFAPYLRGGTFSRLPQHESFFRLENLIGKKPAANSALSRESDIVVSSGSCSLMALLEEAGEQAKNRKGQRWLLDQPLGRRDSLVACLAALRKGAELILAPRLDEDSLKKTMAATKADLRAPGTRE